MNGSATLKASLSTATCALILALASPAHAQVDAASATLTGTVTDATGAVLPGSTITIVSVERGTTRSTATDRGGAYRVSALEPGRYDLRIDLTGFSPQVLNGIELSVGQVVVYDAHLSIGAITESVEVTVTTEVSDPRRTQLANTVGNTLIDAQPNINRVFSAYVLTLPGVTDADAPRSQNPGFVWPTGGFSIGGNNGRNNLLTVDGGEHEYGTGTIRTPLNVASIEEFQVNRSGFAAEFGFTAGTAVSVITKSGTNNLQGEAYSYFRSSAMSARNYFDRDPEQSRNQFVTPGFVIGGPVRRDRLFGFFAVEGLRAEQDRFHSFLDNLDIYGPTSNPLASIAMREQEGYLQQLAGSSDPNIRRIGAALRQTLTTTNYAATMGILQAASGTVPARDRRQHYTARVDAQPGKRDFIMLRATSFLAHTDSSFIAPSPMSAESAGSDVLVRDITTLGTWARSIGTSMTQQLRVQVSFNDSPIAAKSQAPAIDIDGVGAFGRGPTVPIEINQHRFQFEDTVSVFRRHHALKFGASYRPIDYNVRAELFFGGQWTFSSGVYPVLFAAAPSDQARLVGFNLTTPDPATGQPYGPTGPPLAALSGLEAFNLGLPLVMYQGFNNPVWAAWAHYLGLFAQDSWQASSQVTLDYGLRLDREAEPTPLAAHHFVSPRLGVAWDPGSNQKTIVRASAGLFYAPIFFQVPEFAALLNDSGRYINQILLTPLSPQSPIALWQAGVAMGKLPAYSLTETDLRAQGVSIGRGSPGRVLFEVDPTYTNPYTIQSSVSVTRQLRPDLAIEIAYVSYQGRHLGLSQEANYRETGVVDPQLGPMYAPIDPTITQLNMARSIGRSSYNGATVSLTRRFIRGQHFQINYALSHAKDNVTDLDSGFSAFMPTRLDREWADSTFDIRHNLTASAVFLTGPTSSTNVLRRIAADTTFSPVFSARSGLPFTLRIGRDVNGDAHNLYDRPFMADRNSGRGAWFSSLDARVARRLPIGRDHRILADAIVEVSNLLNRTNFIAVNDVIGTDPRYLSGPFNRTGSPSIPPTSPLGFTTAAPARQMQVGLRLQF
jgi:hypothetical protein